MSTDKDLLNLPQEVAVDAQVLTITQAISQIVAQTPSLKVESDPEQDHAIDCVAQINTIAGNIAKRRKELTDPLERQKKAIIAFFKTLEEPLAAAKEQINSKVMSWRTKKRLAQEKADRLAQEAIQQAQQQGLPVLPTVAAGQVTAQPVFETPAHGIARTESGAMGYERSTWTYKVTNMQLLIACAAAGIINPLYLMIDASYLKLQIKANTKDGLCSLQVPGVNIYEDRTLVTRRGGK